MYPFRQRLTIFSLTVLLTLLVGCAGNHDSTYDHRGGENAELRKDSNYSRQSSPPQVHNTPAPNATVMPDFENSQRPRSDDEHNPQRKIKPQPSAQEEQIFRTNQYAADAGINDVATSNQPQSPRHKANQNYPQGMSIAQPYENNASNENYASIENNSTKLTRQEPVSTFSIDVDTGGYTNVRRFINANSLPPKDAVRVEEMINYFNYDYSTPHSTLRPFSVTTEIATTPWNQETQLLQIGLKGYEIDADDRPAVNLVFLLDVSGSMNNSNKLPLLKKSFKLLTKQLTEHDRISIVVYAGASGVVLEPTPGDMQRKIMKALSKLRAGGSTNGAAGINLAYELARDAYIHDGVNRIVLATDGDFNVGTTDFNSLIKLAEYQRQSGISLTTLGFGTGNYNDHLMEQLADAGNGNYAYIDNLQEAKKVLVKEITSTLITIAKDVKVQIEFNPNVVSEYRLIGYENRVLNEEDFVDDKIDAGEIGAGHTVTALYEVKLLSTWAYRNEQPSSNSATNINNELGFLKLRYKHPEGSRSTEMSFAINKPTSWAMDRASDNLRFAAAVAAFGQILQQSEQLEDYSFAQTAALARSAIGRDKHNYRREFLDLVAASEHLAESQWGSNKVVHVD